MAEEKKRKLEGGSLSHLPLPGSAAVSTAAARRKKRARRKYTYAKDAAANKNNGGGEDSESEHVAAHVRASYGVRSLSQETATAPSPHVVRTDDFNMTEGCDLILPSFDNKALTGRSSTFACSNCDVDISSAPRIICAECGVVLCLKCFAAGAEPQGTQHSADHDYRVADNLDFAVFHALKSPWCAADELILLDAIAAYGMGNWEAVASHFASKSPSECEGHYLKIYIYGCDGVRIPSAASRRVQRDVEAQLIERAQSAPHLSGVGFPGYLPLRQDFEDPYDAEAEELLLGLVLDPDADDFSEKMQIVGEYIARLDKRDEMHSFAVDALFSGKASLPSSDGADKDRGVIGNEILTASQEKVYELIKRPLSGLPGVREKHAAKLIVSMQKEMDWSAKVSRMQSWRSLGGLTSTDDVTSFEQAQRQRRVQRLLETHRGKMGILNTAAADSAASNKDDFAEASAAKDSNLAASALRKGDAAVLGSRSADGTELLQHTLSIAELQAVNFKQHLEEVFSGSIRTNNIILDVMREKRTGDLHYAGWEV